MAKAYNEHEVRVATILRYFIGDFPKLVVWEELLERHPLKFKKEQIVSQICSEISTFKAPELREILDKMEYEGVIILKDRKKGEYALNEQDGKVAAFLTFFRKILSDEAVKFMERKRILD